MATLAASASLSQAVVLFSSIGTTAGTTSNITDGNNAGKALNFVTASGDDYSLDTVRLSLSGATTDELNNVNLAIWSDDGTSAPIGTLLSDLSYTGNSTGNIFEFAPDSAITLAANTTYWVALASFDNTGESVGWESFTEAATGTASNTAGLFATGGTGSNPGAWTSSSGLLNAFEVNGTVVPEPSSAALLGLGGLALILRRRK